MPWECGAQCMLLTPEAISIHFSFKPSSSPQWSVSAFSKAKALNFTLTYMFVLAITRETYSCCCCTKTWVNIKVNNHPAVFLAVYLVQWKQLWSSHGKEQGSLSQVLQKLYGLLLKTLIINSSLSPAKAVRMGMIQRHRSRRVTEIWSSGNCFWHNGTISCLAQLMVTCFCCHELWEPVSSDIAVEMWM